MTFGSRGKGKSIEKSELTMISSAFDKSFVMGFFVLYLKPRTKKRPWYEKNWIMSSEKRLTVLETLSKKPIFLGKPVDISG